LDSVRTHGASVLSRARLEDEADSFFICRIGAVNLVLAALTLYYRRSFL
jgi:hypothetical protein